jgi:hypothetical protein
MAMRLPALTRAARAQRDADVLARCITIARTAQEAERFRVGYQLAAARAASLTRTDVPTGLLEVAFGYARQYRRLVALVLLVAAVVVFRFTAPAWLQTDVKWLGVGLIVGSFGHWLHSIYRDRDDQVEVCECGREDCDE